MTKTLVIDEEELRQVCTALLLMNPAAARQCVTVSSAMATFRTMMQQSLIEEDMRACGTYGLTIEAHELRDEVFVEYHFSSTLVINYLTGVR